MYAPTVLLITVLDGLDGSPRRVPVPVGLGPTPCHTHGVVIRQPASILEPAKDLEASDRDWRGFHHLALITPDMDTTVRFYAGVLGMPLVATLRAGPMRHYFFKLGTGTTIAFFEVEGAETFSKPAGALSPRAIQFDHVAFGVPDEEALITLQRRLMEAGCEVTPVVDHKILRSIYFQDPHGIALEASWWTVGEDHLSFQPEDSDLFADPDPVAAIAELMHGGLKFMPTTRLR